ncbi:MAG: glycosyl hydrolase family 79 C-terminal domain-containing protein, partial [Bryobacteraceae bacterium]
VHWIVDFAQRGKNEIVELTGHYYAEGPPSNPAMNISRLLHPNPRLDRNIPIIQRASRESGKPYRMAETNSCYKGGKPGVSDTFASALWGGDYMLQLEQAGFAGINFHGGGEGSYTPIAASEKIGLSARPIYYGMLLAGQFAGTKIVKSTLDAQGVNATAYAAHAGSGLRVANFNKDEQRGMRIQIRSGEHGRLWRLSAPNVHSKTGVTLAGAAVKSDGSWSPVHEEHAASHHGAVAIHVPASSAVLAFFAA